MLAGGGSLSSIMTPGPGPHALLAVFLPQSEEKESVDVGCCGDVTLYILDTICCQGEGETFCLALAVNRHSCTSL